MIEDLFWPLTYYHWLILGVLLLVMEMLGFAGFLIGSFVAAMCVGIVMMFVDLHWHEQFAIFAILSVLFSVIYWRYFQSFNFNKTDSPLLNDRVAQLVGHRHTLENAITNGKGRIQIGDTLWKVKTDVDLAAGVAIIVTGSDGMTLLIEEAE